MIRVFCDQCKNEITDKNRLRDTSGFAARLSASIGHLKVEIMTSQNGTANGDYCKHCVLDALYKLDDRPREATNA